ncbi:MAG TPA: RIP metalloprotease RseP [Bacteroidales bacterium]|nr:RIP metalloprotease RseP [Bacteroidales bacterium]
MSALIMIAQLILGLSILVFVHELGHYLAARAFKIRVDKFYLFFDAWKFRLFKFKKGDTEFGIGWLPLGGYCKIAGMIDESMDKEQMKQPPQPWEFRSKPAWQRLIVMVAGVIMNLIVGMIIFTGVILHYEKEYLPCDSVTNGIYAYPAGRQIGFQTGDKILKVNNKKIERFKDVASANVLMGSVITIDRNGQTMDITVPDTMYRNYNKKIRDFFIEAHNFQFSVDSVIDTIVFRDETKRPSSAFNAGLKKGDRILFIDSTEITSYGLFRELIWSLKEKDVSLRVLRQADTLSLTLSVDSTGYIGITSKNPYQTRAYGLMSGIKYGIRDAMGNLWANIRGLGKIFAGKENASESIQGPIGIMKIYGGIWDWHRFWLITGLISVILAFMNILPIPALDGGHVIFTTWELITGRKLSEKFLERSQVIGMAILIAIMVFAIFNDVWKHFIR